MSYGVRIAGPAQRCLDRQPPTVQRRILARLDEVAEDPYGPYTKPLQGVGGLCGARVGGWRIVFEVDRSRQLVDILEIGPRGDIYRRL